jgi:hypothetical protein
MSLGWIGTEADAAGPCERAVVSTAAKGLKIKTQITYLWNN